MVMAAGIVPMGMLHNQEIVMGNKVIAAISGGKDSIFAAYQAIQQGYELVSVVNTISKEYRRVRFHGLEAQIIALQAEAMGVPLFQIETTPQKYTEEFVDNLKRAVAREKEIAGIVFGDIFLEDCLQWAKEVSEEVGAKVIEPHWGRDSKELLADFIASGFEAVIVSTQADLLGEEWIGRKIDQSFFNDISKSSQLDPCGENGEYHSVVLDGLLFQKRITLQKTRKVRRENYHFLDIQEYSLEPK